MFRDDVAQCVTCDAALEKRGDRQVCGSCHSLLIGPAELGALLDQLAPDDKRSVDQRIFSTERVGDTCPCCTTKMTRGSIHDTALQQCATHGIWMSQAELAQILSEQANLYAVRNRDDTKLVYFSVFPVLGPLIAGSLNVAIGPWAKRRRLRKYLTRTTPPRRSP